MFNLPHSLTCHFRDAAGNFDAQALLSTPDEHLVAIARAMPEDDLVNLYWRLRELRMSWLERAALRAAGVDVDAQRLRFLCILEEAARAPCPSPSMAG
jgi:hypothetical protein